MKTGKRTGQLTGNKYSEYFIPTVLTALASNLASIVDGSIIGNLINSEALAVINVLMPIIQLYFALSILFGIAVSTISAQSRGRDASDFATGNRSFTVMLVSVAAVSVLITVLQLVFLDGIVALLTPDATLQALTKEYYVPFILGTPVTLFMTSLVHTVRTDGRPKFATVIILVSNAVNLLLDLLLIGVFRLDLTGAAIATVAGNAVGLVLTLSHFRRKDCSIRPDRSVFTEKGLFGKYLADIFACGASGAIGTLLTTAKLLFLNNLIQYKGGNDAMIAYSAVSLCQLFEAAFVAGGCQAMVPVVGLLNGENDNTGTRCVLMKAVRILTASCIAITAAVWIFPEGIAGLYGIGGTALSGTVRALRICSLMLVGDALTFLLIYFYMCTDKKVLSAVISVLNGIVLIVPFGLILADRFGIDGVWASLVCAQYAALLIAAGAALAVSALSKGKYKGVLLLRRTTDEVLAFSYSGKEPSDEIRAFLAERTDTHVAEAVTDVLGLLRSADNEKRRKKNADVRICRGAEGFRVIIKSSGAALSESDFRPPVQYSKALGFSLIRFTV